MTAQDPAFRPPAEALRAKRPKETATALVAKRRGVAGYQVMDTETGRISYTHLKPDAKVQKRPALRERSPFERSRKRL